jgi:hypothetical protein
MSVLKWNHKKVQNLTPLEIWMFVAGRVFVSFGIGILAMRYYPDLTAWSGFPSLIVGIVLLIFAAKGLMRRSPDSN